MSDNNDIPKDMRFRDSLGHNWTVPIPEHVQVELAACAAMDQLGSSLSKVAQTLAACSQTRDSLASTSLGPQVHAEFEHALAELKTTLVPVETHATALIQAVSKMLAV